MVGPRIPRFPPRALRARRLLRIALTVALPGALTGTVGCRTRPASERQQPVAAAVSAPRIVTLLATSEIRGTPEPCGCQSDPLGDVARVAGLLTEARKSGAALLLDAGGLRYAAEPVPAEQRAQAELKAQYLEDTWASLGAVVGLGDEDLSSGAAALPPGRRLCANLTGLQVAPPTIRDLDGLRVGVFAVIDPTKVPAPLSASDPIEAARAAEAALRAQGARVVVGLLHLGRADARRLLRAVPGVDIGVAGDECGEAGGEPEQVGPAILLQPAGQAMKAARIVLHLDGDRVSTSLFGGAVERDRALARTQKKLEAVGKELERLAADPQADPAFVAGRKAERERLAAERDQLRGASLTPPSGAYATAELVGIRRKIERDPTVAEAMRGLDGRVGEANRAAAAPIPPPPAPKGQPRYSGVGDCETCHDKAVQFWKTTVHARAWEELVKVGKQWSYDCIGCHTTGFGKAGGSSMAHVDRLEAVQCEVCHGPGSQHADHPTKSRMPTVVPDESLCRRCHTPEHSDTFQYEAYLRDVLGPGHGEQRRAKLPPGPTGAELRHGAKDRAGAM